MRAPRDLFCYSFMYCDLLNIARQIQIINSSTYSSRTYFMIVLGPFYLKVNICKKKKYAAQFKNIQHIITIFVIMF